jgi:HK97 family phage prohead protease
MKKKMEKTKMSNNKREFRFVNAELRTERSGDKRKLTGYAAKYNTKSEDLGGFRETIKPGAFTRAISEKQDVRFLINHDPNLVLGRTTSGTLQLNEDTTGLHFSCDMPDTTYARDLMESVDRGDISQCSFGFMTRKQAWVDDTDEDGETSSIRELHDLDLFDTSAVTYPAYPDTEVHGRSLEARAFPDGPPADVEEHRSKQKTVAGESLTSGDFLLVGDPTDISTWSLPWKFDSEAKTVSHLRDALSRFDQVEGFSAEQKAAAFKKLVHLALAHGIDVSDEEKKKAGISTTDEKKSTGISLENAKLRTHLAEIKSTL